MLYELRVYHCIPGRLPDLLKRFDTITLGIWKRHGIEQAGFWTTAIGDSNQALYYLLKWESLADRETEMERVPGRSRMARQTRRDRKERRHRRPRREQHPAADRLLCGQIDFAGGAGGTEKGVLSSVPLRRRGFQLRPVRRPRAMTWAWISAAPSKMLRMRASHSTRLIGYSSA